jgi:8-amino-7-oxononanoate synthase
MHAAPSHPTLDYSAAPELELWSATPQPDDVLELPRYYESDRPGLFAKVAAFMHDREQVEQRGVYVWQQLLSSASAERGRVEVDGQVRQLLLFSSNNYLGLTTHPRVVAAAVDAIGRYGTGAGASPMLSGTLSPQRALEHRLAEVNGKEDACIFSSGYAANVGVLTALVRRTDSILIDRIAHASLHDGARATGAQLRVFRHNSPADLAAKLATAPGNRIVVVDSVYSMDGDIAPLPELLAVCRQHDAILLIDEAHATGVLGRRGLGLCEHFGVADPRILVVGTLSKALASGGGFFAGPRGVVEYVRHYGRSYMFSTAMPPANAAAALAALEVMLDEPERVAALRANARLLRDGLRARGLTVGPTETPIIPVIVGDQPALVHAARALLDLGVHVNPVLYPAVAREECRLRLSVMATHSRQDIADVIHAVTRALARFPAPALGL